MDPKLQAALDADNAWSAELVRVFGASGAFHERYLPAGEGRPGTELRRLYEAFRATGVACLRDRKAA